MTLTRSAKLYSSEGILCLVDVDIETIPASEDEVETVRIGWTKHLATDVQISEGRLDSVNGWYLTY
jgi:hypothetical protein